MMALGTAEDLGFGETERKDHSEYTDHDGRIILKWNFKK
jgi:hypothetical protein